MPCCLKLLSFDHGYTVLAVLSISKRDGIIYVLNNPFGVPGLVLTFLSLGKVSGAQVLGSDLTH